MQRTWANEWAYNVELPGAYLDRGSFNYVVDDALHL